MGENVNGLTANILGFTALNHHDIGSRNLNLHANF